MKRDLNSVEREFIELNYAHCKTEHIARVLGCPIDRIYRFAYAACLKKDPEYLKSEYCGRKSKGCSGNEFTFKKGHIPANKGKRMPPEVYEVAKKSFFKPGNLPVNTKYDGYISKRKDKTGRVYLYIRVSLGKFELLHRNMWEAENGKIPPGHVITFKDGNSQNCTIDNLEMITMYENRLRNSFAEVVPPELQPIKRMIAGVKTRITKQKRQDEKQH